MTKRLLHVVTNVSHYAEPNEPTGLWLSELTHAYRVFAEAGYQQRIVSPTGVLSPLEPRSLKFPNFDKTAKAWKADAAKMALLADTVSPDQITSAHFDAIYFTGGHAVMWDFPDSEGLHRITREIFEHGGVVSSVCHGYCGLLNTRLSDGDLLVAGRQVTGFSWAEEVLARVNKLVPYNVEQEMKNRGARYVKGKLPFTPYAVVDGRLVTGQNPQSAKATAKKVVAVLGS
jgi:putative intracellular protease/amidase